MEYKLKIVELIDFSIKKYNGNQKFEKVILNFKKVVKFGQRVHTRSVTWTISEYRFKIHDNPFHQ